jgi:hypothetical protein
MLAFLAFLSERITLNHASCGDWGFHFRASVFMSKLSVGPDHVGALKRNNGLPTISLICRFLYFFSY